VCGRLRIESGINLSTNAQRLTSDYGERSRIARASVVDGGQMKTKDDPTTDAMASDRFRLPVLLVP
jgi:hypothetical protein